MERLMKIESIAVLSDVSIGYGSPQIVSLSRSLRDFFGASISIFEPDQPDRPSAADRYPDLNIERIFTASHPYSESGQIDFTLQLSDALRRMKPDLVVLCAFFGAAALLKSGAGGAVIYYGYEHTEGVMIREIRTISLLAKRVDCAIFCEENRAALDAARMGLTKVPTAILYNCSDLISAGRNMSKNGRIIYAGQIDPDRTYGRRLFSESFDSFAIDVYGVLRNFPDAPATLDAAASRNSSVNYCGELEYGHDFIDLIGNYMYSFVAWAPLSESTLYAAPNKFFDAIAAQTPPLCAPHPLCERIVRRYGCGKILPGWTIEDFVVGVDQALEFAETDAYRRMVEEKLPIAARSLTWTNQFKKLEKLLTALNLDGSRP